MTLEAALIGLTNRSEHIPDFYARNIASTRFHRSRSRLSDIGCTRATFPRSPASLGLVSGSWETHWKPRVTALNTRAFLHPLGS